MSGRRALIPAGLGAVDADLQRVADAAYTGEDRALALLAAPGGGDGSSIVKRVIPLVAETDQDATHPVNPRRLLLDASIHGGTAGIARLQACAIHVTGASLRRSAQATAIVARVDDWMESSLFDSSAAGRVDSVYVSVAMSTPVGGQRSRRVKNPTTGAVTTQTVDVYSDATATLLVAPGVEGSATPGTVPADTATTWNVKLADVVLPAGYVSGTILYDGTVGEYIKQRWTRGGVSTQASRAVRVNVPQFKTNCDAGLYDDISAADRGTGLTIVRGTFRNTAAGAVMVLDKSVDWRRRIVRITLIRPAVHVVPPAEAVYPDPRGVYVQGTSYQLSTGWVFTGSSGNVAAPLDEFYTSGGAPNLKLYANSSGAGIGATPLGELVATIADAPDDGANGGDHWVFIAEALDSDWERVL